MTADEAPSPTHAPRWRELGVLGKIARVAAFAFVTTFLALGVAKSLDKGHWLRDRVAPLEQKVWPFRLSSNWRMFVGEARFGYITFETVLSNGDRYQLESFRWEGKSWWDQAKDRRLRKMQAQLKMKPQRRHWGKHYMAYICRTYARDFPDISTIEIVRNKPLVLDDAGKRKSRPKSWVIAKFDCASGRFTEGV